MKGWLPSASFSFWGGLGTTKTPVFVGAREGRGRGAARRGVASCVAGRRMGGKGPKGARKGARKFLGRLRRLPAALKPAREKLKIGERKLLSPRFLKVAQFKN